MKPRTEQEEKTCGEHLAEILNLKTISTGEEKGRYLLRGGYGTKTALGLYRVLESIIVDDCR